MLKEIKSFFTDLTGGKEVAHFEDNDYRLAAAALLVHVATLEGDLSPASRERKGESEIAGRPQARAKKAIGSEVLVRLRELPGRCASASRSCPRQSALHPRGRSSAPY